jgi:hypothetical protein
VNPPGSPTPGGPSPKSSPKAKSVTVVSANIAVRGAVTVGNGPGGVNRGSLGGNLSSNGKKIGQNLAGNPVGNLAGGKLTSGSGQGGQAAGGRAGGGHVVLKRIASSSKENGGGSTGNGGGNHGNADNTRITGGGKGLSFAPNSSVDNESRVQGESRPQVAGAGSNTASLNDPSGSALSNQHVVVRLVTKSVPDLLRPPQQRLRARPTESEWDKRSLLAHGRLFYGDLRKRRRIPVWCVRDCKGLVQILGLLQARAPDEWFVGSVTKDGKVVGGAASINPVGNGKRMSTNARYQQWLRHQASNLLSARQKMILWALPKARRRELLRLGRVNLIHFEVVDDELEVKRKLGRNLYPLEICTRSLYHIIGVYRLLLPGLEHQANDADVQYESLKKELDYNYLVSYY